MSFISNLSETRLAWGLLFLSTLVLEAYALYTQHAMDLRPCIMCIYQRTAVLGLLFAGIIGASKPNNLAVRIVAYTTWGISSVWGLLIAREHIEMQTTTDPFAFSCEFEPNFPEFMPLHHWIPQFFEATGDCGNIDWQFASLSMPAWMEIIFVLFTATLFILVASRLITKKSL